MSRDGGMGQGAGMNGRALAPATRGVRTGRGRTETTHARAGHAERSWAPVRMVDVELGEPLPALEPTDRDAAQAGGLDAVWTRMQNGRRNGRRNSPRIGVEEQARRATADRGRADAAGSSHVRLLLRLHTRPLGQLDLIVGPDGIAPARLAELVWTAAGARVREHVRHDGLPEPSGLGPDGIAAPPDAQGEPRCLGPRREALAHAPHISVVIATRDRTDSLMRCLRSLAALDYPSYDVVVVDSAPTTPATASALADAEGKLGGLPVRYVHEKLPGLALAHNRGLAAASGQWVAFTDDDVEVDRHWLAAVAEAIGSAPRVGCVTGLILPAELATPAQDLLEQYGGFARGFDWRAYSLDGCAGGQGPDDPLFPYTAGRLGSGANMAFDAAALRALGGFDPATGAGTPARGGDDLVGFLRVITAGHTLVYEPAALVRHWHRRDYAGLRRQAHCYGMGLGAYLTSTVVHEPRLLPDMLRRAVPAARHLLDRGSAKNCGKSAVFPRELEIAERLGLLRGPFAYAMSRWRYRHMGGAPARRETGVSPWTRRGGEE